MIDRIKTVLAAALVCVAAVSATAGNQVAYSAFGTVGTAYGTTNSIAVISSQGGKPTPLVTFISATSDLSTSTVQFYTVTNSSSITNANTTTSIPVQNTNAFQAQARCILKHVATDTYEEIIVSSVNGGQTITSTWAPTVATVAGDILYVCSPAGSIPCGATTLTVNGPGIYAGQPGMPLMLILRGTSSCSLNAVCATYQ